MIGTDLTYDAEQIVNNAWTPSFYGYDGGGNVRQLTNSAGAVTDTYEYDAYGNSFTVSGSTPNNYLYRGEQYDSDLGLYYLRARYYNPATGRFMSRDPLDGQLTEPKSMHKYLYADGDPINGVDPMGRETLFTYAAFALNRARAAATFGARIDVCLYSALRSLADALNAVGSGSPVTDPGQSVGSTLDSCTANAIKSLLGMLLSHVPF